MINMIDPRYFGIKLECLMLSSADGVGLSHVILPDVGIVSMRVLSPRLWPMLRPTETGSPT